MNPRPTTLASLLSLAALAVPAAAQCGGGIPLTIEGIHNPYLAGQPAGTMAKSDTAPFASPFLVPMAITGGDRIRFSDVSGDVWNLPGGGGPGPDGWSGHLFNVASTLGISGYMMQENCLLGVFLPDTVNTGPPPPNQSPHVLNKPDFAPLLYQVFFIGDGLMQDGVTQQEWVVPEGATRLFLGSADGWNWSDNSGTFQLTIHKVASLLACTPSVSIATGGTQLMELDAGDTYGGLPYLLLGSISGTTPGHPIDTFTLPLNVDSYLLFTLENANTPPLGSSFGTLGPNGTAGASFTIPQGLSASLAGTTAHHAYVVIELLPTLLHVVFASNAVPVTLIP